MGLYNPVSVTISAISAPTATQTNVPYTNNGAPILSANTARKSAIIYNDSDANLFIKFGGANTINASGDYSLKIDAHGFYEIPQVYTGSILGTWDSVASSGNAKVVEFS